MEGLRCQQTHIAVFREWIVCDFARFKADRFFHPESPAFGTVGVLVDLSFLVLTCL